jgi:hypothetical protein
MSNTQPNDEIYERTSDGLNPNVPEPIEQLYIESPSITLVEFREAIQRLLVEAKQKENKRWQKLVLDRQELHSSSPYINVLEYETRNEELQASLKRDGNA